MDVPVRRVIEVEQRLTARAGAVVSFHVTLEGTLAIMPAGDRILVRASPRFLAAPDAVLEALAVHVKSPLASEARRVLVAFLQGGATERRDPRSGHVHDLQAILEDVNGRFFQGKVVAQIRWSRGIPAKRRRSILFGSYHQGLIKIHPALDQEWVPHGFVAFVVHHELLHAVIPTRWERGKRLFHPREFRERERTYPEFSHWRRWEKENLGKFLARMPSLTESTGSG